MRRCHNCRFENANDATVCARCAQPLVTAANPAAEDAAPALPDWLQSMQRGAESAGTPVATSSASSAVAAAATLPVQVRRSRVPLLSVAGRAGAAEPVDTPSPVATGATAPADTTAVPVRRSNRLRSALLRAIVVLALAYIVVRMYS